MMNAAVTTRPVLALLAGLSMCGAATAQEVAPAGPGAQQPLRMPQGSTGVIVFRQSEVDMGTVLDSETPTSEFRFVNTGPGDVTLTHIKPDCGCTLATLQRVVKDEEGNETFIDIDPGRLPENGLFKEGEEGVLRTSYDTAKRIGAARKGIVIRTDNRQATNIKVFLSVNVIPLVDTEPRIVTFGNNVEKGEAASRILEVYGRSEGFEATKATLSNVYLDKMVHVEVLGTEPAERNGEQMTRTTLKLTLDPELKPGMISDKLFIRTTDERRPIVEVQVIGRVMGDVEAVPATVRLGRLTSGQPTTTELRVKSRSGQPFKVLGIDFNNAELQVVPDVEPYPVDAKNPVEWVIPLRATAMKPGVRVNAMLNVKTDVLREEAVEVRLYGVAGD